jgi:hypothetical protein
MNRKAWLIFICAALLCIASGCSKSKPAPIVVVEVPAGFAGDVLVEMGVKDAPPLPLRGGAYTVIVPRDGKIFTSTLLTQARPTFKNSGEGAVWGYSHSVFTTGDGIPTGGKIEFFVGTRKDYEAEQGKRNHSSGCFTVPESAMTGV